MPSAQTSAHASVAPDHVEPRQEDRERNSWSHTQALLERVVQRYGPGARVSMFRDPGGWCVAIRHGDGSQPGELFGRGDSIQEALGCATDSV